MGEQGVDQWDGGLGHGLVQQGGLAARGLQTSGVEGWVKGDNGARMVEVTRAIVYIHARRAYGTHLLVWVHAGCKQRVHNIDTCVKHRVPQR